MLTPVDSCFVQVSSARCTFSACLWGVQDSLGGAKTRDSSRRPHSPLTTQLHEDIPCPV